MYERQRETVGVKKHRDEVEKILCTRSFTRSRKSESGTERWQSVITNHACHYNHIIDWNRARMEFRMLSKLYNVVSYSDIHPQRRYVGRIDWSYS